MTTPVPTNEPFEARAGTTWAWERDDNAADYPASSWTLTYYFKQEGTGANKFSIVATASGANFVVSVPAATTAAYVKGTYTWVAVVTGGSSEVYEVDRGTLDLLPKYNDTSALDDRSHAQIALDAIEAVIANRASVDQLEYSIAGRSIKRMPVADLLRFRDYYLAEVFAEKNAERRRNGMMAGRLVAKL